MTTIPDSALVIVDNSQAGFCPAEFVYSDTGSRSLRISKAGYMTVDTVIFCQEKKDYRFEFILKEAGYLSLTGEPAGAEIFVNGEKCGSIPLNMEIPSGSYDFVVKNADYFDFSQSFDIRQGETVSIAVKLKKKPGYLTVKGLPDGAKIYAQGGFIGVCPIDSLPLEEGSYSLNYRLHGYKQLKEPQKAEIIPGLNTVVPIVPQAKSNYDALWRSALCPGWGQIYAGKSNKGYAFIAGTMLLLTASAFSEAAFQLAVDEYNLARVNYSQQIEEPDILSAWKVMQSRYDDVEKYERIRNYALTGLGIVYLCNLADAYFLSASDSHPAFISYYSTDHSAMLCVHWRM